MLIPLPLRLAVLGVLAVNAFMIPSTMSAPGLKDDGLDALNSYDISRPLDVGGVSGYLDCTYCSWPNQVDIRSSALFLNFTSAEDSKSILFNSVPIYPVPLDSALASPLIQTQPVDVIQRGVNTNGALELRRSLRYSGIAGDLQLPTDDGWRLISINITVESLDEEIVNLSPIQVQILEDTRTGTVKVFWVFIIVDNEMLASLEMLPRPMSKTLPQPVLHPTESCGTGPFSIFCRLSDFLTSKFSSASPPPRRQGGCRGRAGQPMRGQPMRGPPNIKGGPAKYWRFGEEVDSIRIQPIPFQPHSQPPNGFLRQLHVFIISVIIPVLIGIAAGLTASLFGLVFGTLVAWFWIKFVRGNKMGNVKKDDVIRCDIASKEEQWVEADGLLDEKAGFTSHEEREIAEPPPGYVEKE